MSKGNKIQTNLLFNVEANSAQLKKGIDQANNHLKGFKKQVSSMSAGIKGMFIIDIAKAVGDVAGRIIDFGKELSELAAKGEGIRSAFKNMGNPELLIDMRNAVKGTISDLDLMQQAVTANEFGIPIENMATMMEFAAVQAQKMGKDVNHMAESITTGLARGSIQILDNLGLSQKQLAEETAKGATVQEAALKLMNERLAESGGLMETTAVKQARWKAEVQNTKEAFGNLINKGVAAVIPVLLDLWENVKGFFKESIEYVVDFINGWIELYNESQTFRRIVVSIGLTFKTVWEIVKLVISSIIDGFQSVGRVLGYVLNPKNWGDNFESGLKDVLKLNSNDMAENFSRFGNTMGEAIFDGINEVADGKKELIDLNKISSGKGKGKGSSSTPVVPLTGKLEEMIVDDANFEDLDLDLAPLEGYNELLEKQTQINNDLEQSNPYPALIQSNAEYGDYIKLTNENVNKVTSALSSMQNLGSSLGNFMGSIFGEEAQKNIEESLAGIMEFINVLQSFMNVVESINNLINTMGTLMQWINTVTVASTAAKQKDTAASIANAAASNVEAGSDATSAASKGAKSVAGIPIVGAILAAAAFAMIIGAFIKARKTAKGKFMGGSVNSEYTVVGEQGAELVQLPKGSYVNSNGRSRQLMNNIKPELQPIVMDVKLAGADIYLTQKEYMRKINVTR